MRTLDYLLKDWLDRGMSAPGPFWRNLALSFDLVLCSLHWTLDQIAPVLRESTSEYLLRELVFVS